MMSGSNARLVLVVIMPRHAPYHCPSSCVIVSVVARVTNGDGASYAPFGKNGRRREQSASGKQSDCDLYLHRSFL
jgi:hypothetical protein